MSDNKFYSLVNAERDLANAIRGSIVLRKAIANGDVDAWKDVFEIALVVLDRVETRFLNAYASDEDELDDRYDLIITAAHSLTEAAFFVFGWRTGQMIDPWKDEDPVGRAARYE
jgi:hypothetical protein